jgi:intein/homing endonuclease
MKSIIADEYKRCAKDPVYFFRKYCYIQHPTLGKIKFNLFKFQEMVLKELVDYDYSIILKSRQLGISTLSAGIALHMMIFNKDKNVLVIATKQEVAKNMVSKVRYMYDNLPSWLKEEYVENNKLNLKLKNGSQIKATSSSGDAGRSEAVSMLIVDEAAFIPEIEEIWGSSQQTLACIDKESLILTDKGLFRFEDLKSEYFDYGFNDIDINIINRYGKYEKSNSFYISKESDTLELEFSDGNKIITTFKHPLLSFKNGAEEWTTAENLKIGDEIKCLYNTNVYGKELVYPIYEKYRPNVKSLSDYKIDNIDIAYITGLWIAEGNFGNKKVKSSNIQITNSDRDIQRYLIDKFGFNLIDDRHLNVSFSELYKKLIWLGCKRGAKNKTIPDKILKSSKNEQIAFLQGLFDGDGCATKRGDIKYSSVSKQLILDLHHVLLNFGIKSIIKFIDNTNKKEHKSTVIRKNYRYIGYNLLIYGENARKFFEIIGFRLERKQKRYNNCIKNGSIIRVDKDLIKNVILKSGYTLSHFNNNIAHVDRLLWFGGKGITQFSFGKILDYCNPGLFEYKELLKLKEESENFYYNKLISIKDAGKRITYDLKVPISESFLANFIVNHNTGGRAIVLSCVTKDTHIFMDDGLHTIEDFIDDSKIGGYNIKEYKILGYHELRSGKLFYNNGKVNTKKITTKFSELECSLNHKLFAYSMESGDYVYPMQSKDLKIGDYLAIQKNYNIFGNDDSLDINYSAFHKIKNPLNINKISKELSYLFGLYIAKGNASEKNGHLTISCRDDISWVFNSLGIKYNRYDKMHYIISNKNLLELFNFVGFDLTKKAHEKIIPDKLLRMSKENMTWMIKGMFDGDGGSYKKIINYTSTSEKLINQMRMMLLNFDILSHKYIHTKEYTENRITLNGGKIKHNHDSYILKIYGKNTLKFYNHIGFRLSRKQKNKELLNELDFSRNSTHDVIPNSLELMQILYSVSNETACSLRKKYGLNINGIVNKTHKYFTNNISRETVIKMFSLFSDKLSKDVYDKWKDIVHYNIIWVPIIKIEDNENYTYDFSLNNVNEKDKWQHSVLYNGIIGEQTPNGVANWYHKEWTKAKEGKNKFHTIQLHWSMHPDRDQSWRDEQDLILGVRMAAQECFDANTRVYTSRGLKKISEIFVGDYVLTHTGKFKKVLQTYCHVDDNLLRIHSYNNKNERYVTKNHPFLTDTDKWNELKNINNEDILKSFPLQVKYDWLKDIPTLDLYDNFNPRNFKKVLTSDDTFYVNDRRHKTVHNRYIQMDYDAGYLIGLYLAEGSKCRLRTVFSFDYNKEKDGWPIRLQKIVEQKFGLNNYTMRYKGSNTCDLEISSEVLSSFIDLFVDGNKCHNKKLTDFAYNYNTIQFYSGIFDGMLRGDGYLTNTSNKKILITSQDLIYDMKYISSLLGYNLSSMRIVDKEYKEIYSKKTKLSNKNYNYHNTYILSFYDTKNTIVESEFTNNCTDTPIGYSYKNSIFKTPTSINCKIYIDECDEILPVYNIGVEDDNSYVTEHFIVHNCDADFLASGNTVIDVNTLKFYKETFIRPPLETRGPNKELWVWESPNYKKTYLICADVARGDGSDYSAAHVLDVETMTQVAEFKAQLSTKDFGNFLVGLGSEYNDALIAIENSSIGWAAIQQIIDRNYSNLFYTEQSIKYIDENKLKYANKLNAIEKKMVPGFTTSPASRPLMINKLEEYFRNKDFMLYSERTMNELYAFIWNGQKAEAMRGYNDDLIMALAIGLWVRDTALQLNKLKLQGTKANLDAFTVSRPQATIYSGDFAPAHDQWNIPTGHSGEEEDISKWLL